MAFADTPLQYSRSISFLVAIASILFAFLGAKNIVLLLQNPTIGWTTGVVTGVLLGFLLHELAHEYFARAGGCIARFTLSKIGLLLTLLSGLLRSIGFPFVILAPGYVAIMCPVYFRGIEKGESTVAVAGPAINIILAVIGLVSSIILSGKYASFMTGLREINAWIAFFNLLPFYPLDGSKIIRSNFVLWVIMFFASIGLMYI